MDLSKVRKQFSEEIEKANSTNDIESIRVRFLGKKGLVSEQYKLLKGLEAEDRKKLGATLNELRNYVLETIQQKRTEFEKKEVEQRLRSEAIDVTLPAYNYIRGKIHPLTQVISEVKNIFQRMGFEAVEGPEIEDEWHNFTALNIPQYHPARQMQDTFYLKDHSLLLRTHTSPVQIRHMSRSKLPCRIISVGKVYRADYDATHSPMFHQVEALYIDKKVNMAQLKYCIRKFLREFFNLDNVPLRLRSSYFPFTEPSVEVDIKCTRDKNEGLIIGKGDDWMEIMGAGLVHPNVLENVGVSPEEYSGFALGCGIERLAMLKYGIPDLRAFFEGDNRWLQYYGS